MSTQYRTIFDIVAIMQARRASDTLALRRMIEVRDKYNGDVVMPFPDVKGNPYMKPPVPNILAEAIDQQAQRAASLMPVITAPPKDGSQNSSIEEAAVRRRALYGRWHTSDLQIKLYRAYRHLAGYGQFVMTTLPSPEDGHAMIELRDPLTAYPELRTPDDMREPLNIGFVFSRSADWIRKHFPGGLDSENFIRNADQRGRDWETLWDCVEWIDEDWIVIGVMGPRRPAYGTQEARVYDIEAYEIARYRNKAGCVPVVAPRRITMDRVQGQLMGMLETMDLFAHVTALDIMAMERAIFPDLVIISKTGGPPQIYSGEWHDGRSGLANQLSDAVVQNLESSQGPGGAQVIDNLERAVRSTGGGFGPEQAAGARSGAQIDSLAALASDPKMQESQTLMATALGHVNDHIMAVEKGYAPQQKFFIIPGIRGDYTPVEYVPEKAFSYTPTLVSYPFAGLDMAALNVAVVQLEGSKLISRRSARLMSPMIPDGEQEDAQSMIESIDDSILAGIQARAEQDPTFLPVAAHVRTLVSHGMTLGAALTQALTILQTQQPPPGGEQGAGAAPDAATGLSPAASAMLAATGQAPGVPSSVPPPEAGLSNAQRLNRAISSRISPSAA